MTNTVSYRFSIYPKNRKLAFNTWLLETMDQKNSVPLSKDTHEIIQYDIFAVVGILPKIFAVARSTFSRSIAFV